MEVESVLVTGANRGIGLELVKQLVKLPKVPKFVFATYRDENSTQALKEIQNASKEAEVILIKMDVTKKDDIESVRKILEKKLGEKGLNLLINNAGYLNRQGLLDLTEENLLSHFTINTMGPVMVFKEMLPLLQKSASCKKVGMSVSRAAVLNISSGGGSIGNVTDQTPEKWMDKIISYRISKAALNMAMRVVAFTVKDQGILVTNMCPGWVKTDMGTQDAQLTPEESISAILQTLSKLNESHNGGFIDRNGETIQF